MSAPGGGVFPICRPDVQVGPLDNSGQCVVKDPARRAYYQLGEQEHYLLTQLDGTRDAAAICRAFEQKFGEPLAAEELEEFLGLLKQWGLLLPTNPAAGSAIAPPRRASGSLLAWQLRLLDPDAFFTRIAPGIRFVWTPVFACCTALLIVLGGAISFTDHRQFTAAIPHAFSWDMARRRSCTNALTG